MAAAGSHTQTPSSPHFYRDPLKRDEMGVLGDSSLDDGVAGMRMRSRCGDDGCERPDRLAFGDD